jgi:hypothetical protein
LKGPVADAAEDVVIAEAEDGLLQITYPELILTPSLELLPSYHHTLVSVNERRDFALSATKGAPCLPISGADG